MKFETVRYYDTGSLSRGRYLEMDVKEFGSAYREGRKDKRKRTSEFLFQPRSLVRPDRRHDELA